LILTEIGPAFKRSKV